MQRLAWVLSHTEAETAMTKADCRTIPCRHCRGTGECEDADGESVECAKCDGLGYFDAEDDEDEE
jgi:hypothetical protein